HPQTLLSFPTRRSSDLDTSTLTCANVPSLTDSYPKSERTAMCDGSGATAWAHDLMGRVLTEKRLINGSSAITKSVLYSYNVDGTDRKSTRLNSSHVKIS